MASNEIDVRTLINDRPLCGYQKLIILLGFIVVALDGFDITLMGFIAPELKSEWGVSNQQLGMVMSAALVGLTLGALLSGPLADWLGRKVIIINSVFFFGVWTLVTAFSHTIDQMIFFRFMTGLGLGAAMPNVGTLISEYAPEKKRSFIITVVFCGFTFGAALGGFAASWVIPQMGWHALLLLGGILPLLSVPLLIVKLPESVRFLVTKRASKQRIGKIVEKLAPGSTDANTHYTLPPRVATGKGSMQIVISRQYRFGSLMLWLGYFMALFLVYLLGSWLPTLVKGIGMSVAQAAVITALYQAGGTFGSLFAGWLMDRVNPHRALGVIYLLGAAFTLSIGLASHSSLMLGVLALACGFCLNGANTGMNALSAHYYPTEARATGSSWMHGVGRIGAILSAFAGAEMLALGWGFDRIFTLIAIPALITACAIFIKGAKGFNRQAKLAGQVTAKSL
ncbi:aromatic acid/H+ symport family MFS transporter [Serratia proteamaculans]|uniref:Aromatic acid/H+ symport family MFS transporter n=1 Tax=Serratia proteamaculans TaxID=28151 RepID=A0A7U0N5W6_SERPR|nr:aromatic acid/H+ symport family MFS transporter [Serratia proteamaculans]MBO1501740.1 aromatic acid/H+ symport family MFS transporter [Serratia proteamaculans]MDW5508472.1 aromatic acid/H+ symport family MFS transporter [Serratia proteamaculans]QQX52929.1 aromatic acid/H+ symport family MFS transporter [Serratia proteamaculans]